MTHAAPSPKFTAADFSGTVISAITLFVAGSIRESMPFMSLTIQKLPSPVATPPSLCAGPISIVATTALVFISIRETDLPAPLRSPQLGTQMVPNPAANPEQGRVPTVTAANTLFVFGSSRCTVFFGPLVTHTASSVRTCQSGVPSTGNTASGAIAVISRFTPAVVTPGGGGRRPFFGAGGGLCGSCCGFCARTKQTGRSNTGIRNFRMVTIQPVSRTLVSGRSATGFRY